MRKIIISLVAASAVFAAVPASAQGHYGRGDYYGHQRIYPGDRQLVQRFDRDIRQAQHRIERLAERRAISPGEYRALHEHARKIRERLYRFTRNGLSRGEVHDIADRIHNLHDRIRDERRDGRRYGYGYDYRSW